MIPNIWHISYFAFSREWFLSNQPDSWRALNNMRSLKILFCSCTALVLTTLKSIKRVLEVSLWKKFILNTKCISHCVFFLAVCQLNKPINMHCQPQAFIQSAISSSWVCCPIFVIDTYFKLESNHFLFLGRMPTMLIFAKYMSNYFYHSFLLLGRIHCTVYMLTVFFILSSNYFFFLGRMPIPLQRIPSITSSAPPAIEPSRPSLS